MSEDSVESVGDLLAEAAEGLELRGHRALHPADQKRAGPVLVTDLIEMQELLLEQVRGLKRLVEGEQLLELLGAVLVEATLVAEQKPLLVGQKRPLLRRPP
jgi:hypothetical protein